jgi:hypothetical protein
MAVLGLTAVCTARPQGSNTTPIPIISYNNEGVNFDGSYKWRWDDFNSIWQTFIRRDFLRVLHFDNLPNNLSSLQARPTTQVKSFVPPWPRSNILSLTLVFTLHFVWQALLLRIILHRGWNKWPLAECRGDKDCTPLLEEGRQFLSTGMLRYVTHRSGRCLVNTGTNTRVSWTEQNVLSSWDVTKFSRARNLSHI